MASAWGEIDDLGFFQNSEQSGAEVRPAHDRCDPGVLCGRNQARRAAERATQHGDEIGSESFPQVNEVVQEDDVARPHVRHRRLTCQMQDGGELLTLGVIRGPAHSILISGDAGFPNFVALFFHFPLSLPARAARNVPAVAGAAKPSTPYLTCLPPQTPERAGACSRLSLRAASKADLAWTKLLLTAASANSFFRKTISAALPGGIPALAVHSVALKIGGRSARGAPHRLGTTNSAAAFGARIYWAQPSLWEGRGARLQNESSVTRPPSQWNPL